MKIINHLLQGTEFFPSPNFYLRPSESDISLIVIHGISLPPSQFGGPYIMDLFLNRIDPQIHPYFESVKDLRVSAHLLIARDGVIQQFVPFNMAAHHAGESVFQGRKKCNDFSIGIELEGADEIPYTDIQYKKLNGLIKALQKTYPLITADRVVGHSDIAPGRKTDPGPSFDWKKIRSS